MPQRQVQKGIMKAQPLTASLLSKLGTTCIAQRKLRGQRARVIWVDGSPILNSSYGIPFSYMEHITQDLARANRTSLPLDGELYCHDPKFTQQYINSICNRSVNRHPEVERIHYYIFDLATRDPQWQRLMELDWEMRGLPSTLSVHVLPNEVIQTAEWKTYCKQYLEEGYEGIILRDLNGHYAPIDIFEDAKRPHCILKFKPSREDYYCIIGYKEGTGWATGMLGSLEVQGLKGGQSFWVGTGDEFTKPKRQRYWNIRDELIGKYLLVKHEPIATERGIPICTSGYKIVDEAPEESD